MKHPYHAEQEKIFNLYVQKERAIDEITRKYEKEHEAISDLHDDYVNEFYDKVSEEITKIDPDLIQWASFTPVKVFFKDYWVSFGFGCNWTSKKENHADDRLGVTYLEYHPDGIDELDRLIVESEIRKHFGLTPPTDSFDNYSEVAQMIVNKVKELPALIELVHERISQLENKESYFGFYNTTQKYYFEDLLSKSSADRERNWQDQVKWHEDRKAKREAGNE